MKKKALHQLKDWTRRVTKGQRESAVFLNLWSDTMATDPSRDPVPVMQLGYAMLLDKPIVIIAPHGSRIPENAPRARSSTTTARTPRRCTPPRFARSRPLVSCRSTK